ncbi:hypothetical protein ASE75_13655 [Sphingomonas sp. Leaf17]|nr:hypothetical protein ASE75_13655 [Sphingomonas sp. Leaf17]
MFKQDALDWLDGKQFDKIRSNYAIAVAFAAAHPGHNAAATQRRIMDKLAKKRASFLPYSAFEVISHERPFAEYFSAIERISSVSTARFSAILANDADLCRGKLQRYREKIGEPATNLTIHQIEERLDSYVSPQQDPGSILEGLRILSEKYPFY